MAFTIGVNQRIPYHRSSGATIVFPDVCKTPSPPAETVPIPYPNAQYEENLKKANQADAAAKSGNRVALELVRKAIGNLEEETGVRADSATQAVIIGKTLHGRKLGGGYLPQGAVVSSSRR